MPGILDTEDQHKLLTILNKLMPDGAAQRRLAERYKRAWETGDETATRFLVTEFCIHAVR